MPLSVGLRHFPSKILLRFYNTYMLLRYVLSDFQLVGHNVN